MKKTYWLFLFCIPLLSFVPMGVKPKVNPYKKLSGMADSIFKANRESVSFSYQSVADEYEIYQPKIAVMIGPLYTDSTKNALLAYSTSDSTVELKLFECVKGNWNLLQQFSMAAGYTGPSQEFVWFANIDDTAPKELLILTEVFEIRSGVLLKAFSFHDKKLNEIRGFEQYPNPEYDEKTKKIYSYMGNGCADMRMYFANGHIQDDSLVSDNEITCDCCPDETGSLDSCEIFINNLKSFKIKCENAYEYVQPYYQDFIKDKLIQAKQDNIEEMEYNK